MQEQASLTTVRTAADMQALDLSKIAAENLSSSIYEAISQSAERQASKIAIQYLLDGDCLDPARIPLKKKLLHRLLKTIKGKSFAEPYREISYRELSQNVTQVANALVGLGVGRQDVTSIVMPNFPETYYSLWGAETAGIANPINPLLEASVIKDIMIASGSRVLIALGPVPGSDIWGKILKVKDQVPSLRAVISVFGDEHPPTAVTECRYLLFTR